MYYNTDRQKNKGGK